MNRMKDTDWEKLPNGFMWRRDPSTMKFIGLRSAAGSGKDSRAGGVAARETATGSSGTLTMTSTTFAKAKESLGTLKKTSGTLETVRGTLGTLQKTSGTLETERVSLGTLETTGVALGTPNKTLGTVPTTGEPPGSIHGTPRSLPKVYVPFATSNKGTLGSFATAHEMLGTVKATSGSFRTPGSTKGTSVTMRMTSGTMPTMGKTAGTIGTTVGKIVTTSGTMGMTAKAIGSIRSSGTTVGLSGTVYTPIIQHIIMLCGFESNSVMVDYIIQEGWTTLQDVVAFGINDANKFHTVKSDGVTFKSRPLATNIRMFKAFLTYYKQMSCNLNQLFNTDDVMELFTAKEFSFYICSNDYQMDMAAAGSVSAPSFEVLVAAGVFHISY